MLRESPQTVYEADWVHKSEARLSPKAASVLWLQFLPPGANRVSCCTVQVSSFERTIKTVSELKPPQAGPRCDRLIRRIEQVLCADRQMVRLAVFPNHRHKAAAHRDKAY